MAGAFIISRDIFENPIWQNNTEFRMFLLILGKAIWKEEGRRIGSVTLKKGQWIRSYRNLQSDLEYIENNVVKKPGIATIKRTVDKLVLDGRITIKQTELGTLFTVVNYCKYQDLNTYKNDILEQQRNTGGTAAEQQRNNKNKDNKGKKEDKIYTPDSQEYVLSQYLFKKMLGNNPTVKEPDLNKWAISMDKILRLDNRPVDEVVAVIDFCQSDSFWKSNILSVDKLRKQYDQLNTKRINNKYPRKGDEEYDKYTAEEYRG